MLPLTPFWERDTPAVLVAFPRVPGLCHQERCERLAVPETLRRFEDAANTCVTGIWKSWEIRAFLSNARPPGLALRDAKDSQLIPLLRRAIESGDVVGLRKSHERAEKRDDTAKQRRLVRQVEQLARTGLSYAGRQYKLVADVDLEKTPGRNNYEVVGHDDAQRVLSGVAGQSGTVPGLTALLAQASELLARNWRPPLQPDGLVLLRRLRQASAAPKDEEPAITPSQMKQQIEQLENVHPVIEGTSAELDLAEVDLPPASDESADDSASGESAGPADASGESDDSPDDK